MNTVAGDLHIHSRYSDGTDASGEIAVLAAAAGLAAVSLTDHDTVGGFTDFQRGCLDHGIIPVPGVEISTSQNDASIHILGYGIKQTRELGSLLLLSAARRTENTKLVLDALNRMNILDYKWADVERHARGKGWISSSFIYECMLSDGIFADWSEWPDFYLEYFSRQSPAFMSIGGIYPADAIKAIRGSGGIPVLAHPGLMGSDAMIDRMVEEGLLGIEVFYPAHTEIDAQRYLRYVLDHGLIATGGSDYHGKASIYKNKIGDSGLDGFMLEKFLEAIS
ncbi:MAG: PHP domain-containing protein [Clostridia bacterium]|nr:PHP domain-containing protein [Clostridia bacterium]